MGEASPARHVWLLWPMDFTPGHVPLPSPLVFPHSVLWLWCSSNPKWQTWRIPDPPTGEWMPSFLAPSCPQGPMLLPAIPQPSMVEEVFLARGPRRRELWDEGQTVLTVL